MALSKSKKAILIFILVAILAVAGWMVYTNKSNDSNSTNTNASKSATQKSEEKIYTPEEILANISDYKDKEISVKGSVLQLGEKEYYLVGTALSDDKKPNSVKLVVNKSDIDLSQYSNKGSNAAQPPSATSAATEIKSPVVVSGKFIQENPSAEPYLQVVTVQE